MPIKLKPGMSKWWPTNGRLPSEELMKSLKEAGIYYVETGIRQSPGYVEFKAHEDRLFRVIGRFQDAGINVWSVHTPFGREIDISNPKTAKAGIELYKKIMEVCAKTGVDKVIIHGSSEPIKDEERTERIACCIRSLNELYRSDVKIALENLPRTCLCNTKEETLEILSALNGKIGCCIDVNHSHKGSVTDFIEAVKDYLITLHISDDDGLDEKHWLPGRGVINWKGIMESLAVANYKGIFLYELMLKFAYPDVIMNNYSKFIKKL